jgi:hypothetical protein
MIRCGANQGGEKKMKSDDEFKGAGLDRLYDLFWQSSSGLDKALLKAKIRMVAAKLDRIEMTGTFMPNSDRS